jgi:hypothetical protein
LSHKAKDDMVDVLGVITQVGALGSITTQEGRPLAKRTVDAARHVGAQHRADAVGRHRRELLGRRLAGARVQGGARLRLRRPLARHDERSAIDINPPGVPEVQQLRQWVDAQGGVANIPMYALTVMGGSGGGAGGGAAAIGAGRLQDV